MSETAQQLAPRHVLRVAIVATDPVRRLGLAAIVANAGHRVSERPDEADVMLADGVTPETDRPVVALGDGEAGQPGLLPRDASPEKIDAAIRAVAAGLVVRAADLPRPAFGPIAEEELSLLTPREVEVLAAIGNGLSNKAVGLFLFCRAMAQATAVSAVSPGRQTSRLGIRRRLAACSTCRRSGRSIRIPASWRRVGSRSRPASASPT